MTALVLGNPLPFPEVLKTEEENKNRGSPKCCYPQQDQVGMNGLKNVSKCFDDLKAPSNTHRPTHQGATCLMCDDVKFISGPQGEFVKHLVEVHFRERLISMIPLPPPSESDILVINNEVKDATRKVRCPFPTCNYEHTYRWLVAKHYGAKHRMALTYYEEVTGEKCIVLPVVRKSSGTPSSSTSSVFEEMTQTVVG